MWLYLQTKCDCTYMLSVIVIKKIYTFLLLIPLITISMSWYLYLHGFLGSGLAPQITESNGLHGVPTLSVKDTSCGYGHSCL